GEAAIRVASKRRPTTEQERWVMAARMLMARYKSLPSPDELEADPRLRISDDMKIRWIKAYKEARAHSPIEHRITYWRQESREISVALSQLKELGEQAVAAVAASLACGGPVVRGQLIASRFYEALRHELKQSPMHDTKRAALIAASNRCER